MTKKELVEKLSNFSDDMKVCVFIIDVYGKTEVMDADEVLVGKEDFKDGFIEDKKGDLILIG